MTLVDAVDDDWDRSGSIHQVGREIKQAPCNGREHGYVVDTDSGERIVIDVLREKHIAEAQASGS